MTVTSFAAPTSLEKYQTESVSCNKEALKFFCAYVEWHPKLWCLTGTDSKHERRDTEFCQCSSSLSCSEEASAQEGTWEKNPVRAFYMHQLILLDLKLFRGLLQHNCVACCWVHNHCLTPRMWFTLNAALIDTDWFACFPDMSRDGTLEDGCIGCGVFYISVKSSYVQPGNGILLECWAPHYLGLRK